MKACEVLPAVTLAEAGEITTEARVVVGLAPIVIVTTFAFAVTPSSVALRNSLAVPIELPAVKFTGSPLDRLRCPMVDGLIDQV